MTRYIVFLLLALMLQAAYADDAPHITPNAAWCAGWKAAAAAVMANRDANRRLGAIPEPYASETHEQTMTRLYRPGHETPWDDLALDDVQTTAIIMADSIDLYVVLPPIPDCPL